MYTPILSSQALKPNEINTDRNSFIIVDNVVVYLSLKLSSIQDTIAGQSISEWMDYCLPVE